MRVSRTAAVFVRAGIILLMLVGFVLPVCAAGGGGEVAQNVPIKLLFGDRGVTQWSPQTYAMVEWAKRMGNVKLELIPVPQSDELAKFNSIIASGNLPDLMIVGGALDIAKLYGPKGLFYRLDETFTKMPNLNAMRKMYPEYDKIAKAADGHIYQYLLVTPWDSFNRGPAFSPKAAKLGIDPRKDIKTMDDLYNLLKKLKASDPTNYPWVSRTGSWGANLGEFYRVFGTDVTFYLNAETNKYSFGPLEANFRSLVEFMSRAWKDGIMHPDFFTMGEEVWRELMASGKASFTYDASVGQATWFGGKQGDPTTWWTTILAPELNGKRYYASENALNVGTFNTWMISAKTKYITNLVQFCDWMYSEEGAAFGNFGSVGETCERMPDGLLRYILPPGNKWPNLFTYGDILAGGLYNWEAQLRQYDNNNKWTMPQFGGSVDELAYVTANKKYYTDNKALRPAQPALSLTETEMDRIKQIKTALDTYAMENAVRFITGQKPMSEWDGFVSAMKNMNAEEAIKIYQAAYDRYMKL